MPRNKLTAEEQRTAKLARYARNRGKSQHVYVDLAEPVNDFRFEGVLTLPPLKIEVDEGKIPLTCFLVGHRLKRPAGMPLDKPVRLYCLAYGSLAEFVKNQIRQGDHVLVRGGFEMGFRGGRPYLNNVVQSVERVYAAETNGAAGLL